MPIPKRVEAVIDNGKAFAGYLGEQIKHIPEARTPNYVVSTGAASLFALIYASSSFEQCYTSYLALAGCLLSTGIAINQFGIQRTASTLSTGAMSFFAPKQNLTPPKDARNDHPLIAPAATN